MNGFVTYEIELSDSLTAGDVNGDGYSDVIIGARSWDSGSYSGEGKAYVYHGSSGGLSTSTAWDVDPTNQADANFGYTVSTAGDVNGDGYSDVIIGANLWDSGYTGEGKAFVYHGTSSGLSTSLAWSKYPTSQTNAYFGSSVSTAGDVNGDGYSDVIIGAYGWDSGSFSGEGKAYVYHGSSGGLSTSSAWDADPTTRPMPILAGRFPRPRTWTATATRMSSSEHLTGTAAHIPTRERRTSTKGTTAGVLV